MQKSQVKLVAKNTIRRPQLTVPVQQVTALFEQLINNPLQLVASYTPHEDALPDAYTLNCTMDMYVMAELIARRTIERQQYLNQKPIHMRLPAYTQLTTNGVKALHSWLQMHHNLEGTLQMLTQIINAGVPDNDLENFLVSTHWLLWQQCK